MWAVRQKGDSLLTAPYVSVISCASPSQGHSWEYSIKAISRGRHGVRQYAFQRTDGEAV
jgi:hypothetical protein